MIPAVGALFGGHRTSESKEEEKMRGEFIDEGNSFSIEVGLFEKLEGPKDHRGNRRHYLPCGGCGDLQLVGWNTVGVSCDRCYPADAPRCTHRALLEPHGYGSYCEYCGETLG